MSANPIPHLEVPTDLSGVLNCIVKQTDDNSPSEDQSGIHYSERFKGPYLKLKEVLSRVFAGQTIEAIHATLQSWLGIVEQITYPECPRRGNQKNHWICDGIRVEESQFGDHGFLNLSYSAQPDTSSGEDKPADDPYQDVWSVSWQSYTVQPYGFCSNKPNFAYPASPSTEDQPESAVPQTLDWSSSMREHISQYMTGAQYSITTGGKTYYYYAPDKTQADDRYFLNAAEAVVLEKVRLDRHAVYHYPIVVHQTVQNSTYSALSASLSSPVYGTEIGVGIDHAVDQLSGCPYDLGDWKFIKIGDDMTQVKSKTQAKNSFTRRETFMGTRDFDPNFYGNGEFAHTEQGVLSGRWPIGGV